MAPMGRGFMDMVWEKRPRWSSERIEQYNTSWLWPTDHSTHHTLTFHNTLSQHHHFPSPSRLCSNFRPHTSSTDNESLKRVTRLAAVAQHSTTKAVADHF